MMKLHRRQTARRPGCFDNVGAHGRQGRRSACARKALVALALPGLVALGLLGALPASAQQAQPLDLQARPGPAQGNQAQTIEVTFRNDDRVAMTSLQLSPKTATQWGDNRLTEPLAPGRSVTLRLPRADGCVWDVRAVSAEGRAIEGREQNLCERPILIVSAPSPGQPPGGQPGGGPQAGPGQAPGQPPGPGPGGAPGPGPGPQAQAPAQTPRASPSPDSITVVLRNASQRATVREVQVSLSSESGWGNDRLGDAMILPGQSYELRLPRSAGCRWDFRASFNVGYVREIMNQDLCAPARPEVVIEGAPPGTPLGSGTGFFVTPQGHIVTNRHVVEGCGYMVLDRNSGAPVRLETLAEDARDDLALLRLPGATRTPVATLRATAQRPVRPGENVYVVGYPVPSQLSEVNITGGMMSAAVGGRGNTAQFQFTAPAQPGNSGGPVLDDSALVVGVVVSGLDQVGSRIMQNINFGIHASTVKRFLLSQDVSPQEAVTAPVLPPADLRDRALPWVVRLGCRG